MLLYSQCKGYHRSWLATSLLLTTKLKTCAADVTLDDWSFSLVSNISFLAGTLNPYTPVSEGEMCFPLFNGQRRFGISALLGEGSHLALGQTLHLPWYACFQSCRHTVAQLLPVSLALKNGHASSGPPSCSIWCSGNAGMVNLQIPWMLILHDKVTCFKVLFITSDSLKMLSYLELSWTYLWHIGF